MAGNRYNLETVDCMQKGIKKRGARKKWHRVYWLINAFYLTSAGPVLRPDFWQSRA